MKEFSTDIEHDGILKRMSGYAPHEVFFEYIENALDAKATEIEINFVINQNTILEESYVLIKDNGIGISENDMKTRFHCFDSSFKNINKGLSDVFGKDGIGRLSFLNIGSRIEYNSYFNDSGVIKNTKILINDSDTKKFFGDSIIDDSSGTGTEVKIFGLKKIDINFYKELISCIGSQYGWYLKLKKTLIKVNNIVINYQDFIEKELLNQEIEIDGNKFLVDLIKWQNSIRKEESKIYFLNGDGKEVFKKPTSFNNQGDGFNHSIYVQSVFFDDKSIYVSDDNSNKYGLFFEKKDPQKQIYNQLIDVDLKKLIRDFRRPFIQHDAKQYVEEITSKFLEKKDSDILSNYTNTIVSETIEELYYVSPKLFNKGINTDHQNIFIRLIVSIIKDGDPSSLFTIIDSVLSLSKQEKDNFAKLLKNIKLSNIIKTINIIDDRLKAIEQINELIFNPEKKTNEVPDLQEIISSHYWLFGDEYSLISGTGEVKFQENLKKLLKFQGYSDDEKDINDPNKLGELDILLAKQDRFKDKTINIVIELKHPSKTLGETEYSQIYKYVSLIKNNNEFNIHSAERVRFLLGKKEGDFIQTQKASNEKQHGKDAILGLPNPKITVYSKARSNILEDNRHRLKYLKNELEMNMDELKSKIELETKEEIKNDLLKKNLASQK